jgi:DNA-binding CsgD family transcriptional regulator
LDASLEKTLHWLSIQQQRTEDEITADLIEHARRSQLAFEEIQTIWHRLTPREQQVLILICQEFSTAEMVDYLGLSVNTVKSHITNLFTKLDIHSRVELRIMFADVDFPQLPPRHARKSQNLRPPVRKT